MEKIGIQLYAVRNHFCKDMNATFAALKKMGYNAVEGFGGLPCRAAQLSSMLADNGLTMCGWHTGFDHLEGDKLFTALEYHERIGNTLLGLNAGPEMLDTPDKVKQLRDRMIAVQENLQKYGFTLEYHNHWWEFEAPTGQRVYNVLMDNSPVAAQFDIGNALKGGVHAMEYLQRHNGRHIAMHMKPFSNQAGFDCIIGKDDVQWQEIIAHCRANGTKHYIVEFEQTENQLELARQNLEGLAAIMKQD